MEGLRPEQRELLPNPSDVAFYRTHGYWVSPRILDDEVLADARLGAERHWSGQRDHKLPIAGGHLDWKPRHGPDKLRLNDYVSLQNDALGRLVKSPIIAATAACLAATKRIRLFHDQLVYKPPRDAGTETVIGWHTDKAYWATCSSVDMLTAWVAFDDCDASMGPVSMIDGSHRWPGVERLRDFREKDLAALEQRFVPPNGQPLEIVPMLLRRGQVSFHHCRTLHGSRANQSGVPRLALTIHLQDDANRHVPKNDPTGREILHVNDMMCRADERGLPDYTDPAICPVLWEEA